MKPLLPCAIASSAILAQDAGPVRVMGEAPGWFVRNRQSVRGDRLAAKEEITGRGNTDMILDCGAAGWIAYTCKQARAEGAYVSRPPRELPRSGSIRMRGTGPASRPWPSGVRIMAISTR